ncbi:cold shock protein 1-like [Solanum dulcamara]|uniref:cold shock protein 1-like n=1 Tax=Solanum dulcamara TaxID=45834 RepID=UPI002484FD05|nr:cold shock protein 1-like [Solanum dulcamara]
MDAIKDQVTPASEAPLNQQEVISANTGRKERKWVSKINAIREKSRGFNGARTNSCSSLANSLVSRPNKEKRPFPLCNRCSRTHQGECMAGKEGFYKCGGMGHKMRDYQVASSKGRESKRARCKGGASQSKPGGSFSISTISKCGKNHRGECLVGSGACYKFGKPGHYARECRSGTRPQALAQTIGHPD